MVIGMQGGVTADLDLGKLMAKRAAIIATGLRARPLDEKLADVAEAHRLMESSTHIGKILLQV
ncbi:hypothetical protein [Streptacidiphilus sp. PAMC 29251]